MSRLLLMTLTQLACGTARLKLSPHHSPYCHTASQEMTPDGFTDISEDQLSHNQFVRI